MLVIHEIYYSKNEDISKYYVRKSTKKLTKRMIDQTTWQMIRGPTFFEQTPGRSSFLFAKRTPQFCGSI